MRDEAISLATMKVVSRFGLKKTTMADIADEAQISRQTLYNAYPSKEAVLQASVKFLMLNDLEKVKAEWMEATRFDEKLDSYFCLGPVAWFDSIQAMPDAAELLEGISKLIEPALDEAHRAWIDALAELLREHLEPSKAHELADFIFISAKNAKYSAKDRDQLVSRLALLREMVVSTYL